MKLCLIYNFAQHYRTSIFRLIDQNYDCDFFFGDNHGDIKLLDYNLLKGKVVTTHTQKMGKGWYFQKGIPGLIHQNYDAYLMLGESRALSTWLFLLMSKFYPKKKVYLWSHGWYGKETKAEKFLKKVLFKLANGGLFLYGNYAKELMIREGFDPKKIFVIHNSLAYEKQLEIRNKIQASPIYAKHFKNTNPTIIFIGRLTKVKKIHLLIEAVERLQHKGQNYNLVLVGDGVEKDALQELVKRKNLVNNVWFYGACYDEQVNAELIYNADLCVAPGNVGLTAMHVMVFGTPVITHNDFRYQMPEFEAVIPNQTGDFFEYDDIDSLSACIGHWFDVKSNKREEVRMACYKEIDESWNPDYQIAVINENLVI